MAADPVAHGDQAVGIGHAKGDVLHCALGAFARAGAGTDVNGEHPGGVGDGIRKGVPEPAGILPLLAETVIGLMLGMGLRLFILVLQTAGAMAAQATTLSQMFGDAGPEPQPAIGNLLVMAGLAVAVAAGAASGAPASAPGS